jgi:hypothetical protein
VHRLDNIGAELWTKMSTTAYNAVSARRAKWASKWHARQVVRLAVEETAAVARASGIHLPG